MGGMRALEWGVTYPDRVERMVVLACGAAATAEQIALCAVQAQAIRLDPGSAAATTTTPPTTPSGASGWLGASATCPTGPSWSWTPVSGGPRKAARTPGGRPLRGRELPRPSRRQARPPLRRQQLPGAQPGHGPPRRRAGPGWDRGRLGRVTAASTVIAVDSDRLYPPRLQYEMAALLPGQPDVQIVPHPTVTTHSSSRRGRSGPTSRWHSRPDHYVLGFGGQHGDGGRCDRNGSSTRDRYRCLDDLAENGGHCRGVPILSAQNRDAQGAATPGSGSFSPVREDVVDVGSGRGCRSW